MLISGTYKSLNSNSINHELLNGLISQAIDQKYTSTVILGDFNFPEINWNTWAVSKNENHSAFHFIECTRDNFLYQHSDSFTRFREGQDPSCLDTVLTDKKEIIEDLKIGDKLGASDHASIIFDIICGFQRSDSQNMRANFYKADYVSIKDYLKKVDWNEKDRLATENF